jgi:uncharacterized protein (TIGR02145 family)
MSTALRASALFSALALSAVAGTYSGKLVELDGPAKAGVTVTLKRGGDSYGTALTGADGTWSIDPSTSASRIVRTHLATGNLVVDASRRIRVEFGNRDLAGRMRSGLETSRFSKVSPAFRTLEGGAPDTLVYSIGDKVFLRDTISASDSGIVRIFDTTWNPAIVYGYVKDTRDSNVYRTVKVGTQTWFAQNLAFKRDTSWRNRDSLALERRFGRLYQWTAAMDTSGKFNTDVAEIELPWRGICPVGWHIPSDAEWSTLVKYADSLNSGKVLKALDFASSGSAAKAIDSLGFRVMAGGQVYWRADGIDKYVYTAFGTNAYFWSASEMSTIRSWGRSFGSTIDHSLHSVYLKTNGQSVRCIRD